MLAATKLHAKEEKSRDAPAPKRRRFKKRKRFAETSAARVAVHPTSAAKNPRHISEMS